MWSSRRVTYAPEQSLSSSHYGSLLAAELQEAYGEQVQQILKKCNNNNTISNASLDIYYTTLWYHIILNYLEYIDTYIHTHMYNIGYI